MPIDTATFTMEQVNMIKKIFAIQQQYELSTQEFIVLINLHIEKIAELPNDVRYCENVLFEIFARLFKQQELSKWMAKKLGDDFLSGITSAQDPLYKFVIDSVNQFYTLNENGESIGDASISTFLIYYNVYKQVHPQDAFTTNIPPFSAISSIKEMIGDECATVIAPPGGA